MIDNVVPTRGVDEEETEGEKGELLPVNSFSESRE